MREVHQDEVSIRREILAARVMLEAIKLHLLCGKANFNPNQPRMPRGHPDGGQWTRIDEAAGKPASNGALPLIRVSSGPDDLPELPEKRPPAARERYAYVKRPAVWAARQAIRASALGRVQDALTVARWTYDYYPYVRAYLDEPRSLQELQRAAREPKKGYNIHHIVEQTPARQDGFANVRINAPDNLVRIPTLKHWEITAWYNRKNVLASCRPETIYATKVGRSAHRSDCKR